MARKKANIHYIYKTTCNVTKKWYVGMHSTNNLDDGYMGSGKVLRHSIRKYGVENHTKEILEYLPSREILVLREQEIVTKELISDGFCMNLKEGGNGGFRDEEHMMKCSKAGNSAFKNKIENDGDFKEKFKKLLLMNIEKGKINGNCRYDSFKGKTHSDESKQLISETKKGQGAGEANSQYGTCWMTRDGINKKVKKDDIQDHLFDGWITGRK